MREKEIKMEIIEEIKEKIRRERISNPSLRFKHKLNDPNEDMHETIEFCILEDNYKPSEKEIREMAIEIKSLKKEIDIFDDLCEQLEEENGTN